MIKTNEYQTQLTDELLNSLKEEVRTDLLDILNNVEFVRRLISPERKYARDLDRDSKGRIIVDISNPHILENMEYFTPAARHFQKHGCYTKLMPNPNPQSEYGQWLRREVLRCWNGMVRESDGEWITGDMYFYLNYFPIIQTKMIEGTNIGDRVTDFPEVWEGVYWRFHYWHQARYGGIYDDFKGGKHCVEIASRGKSKSYSFGSKLVKNFVVGENATTKSKVRSLIAAYQKEYLIKDGTLNKFIDGITHCAKHTQFPSRRLKQSMSDLNWRSGFLDQDTGLEMGTLNEVLGVAIKDDSDKLRGKRPLAYSCNVITPDGYKKWSDIKIGDVLFSDTGELTNVTDLIEVGEQDIYKITLKDGRTTYCTKEHPWEIMYRSAGKTKIKLMRTEELINNTVFTTKKYSLYKFNIRNNGCVKFDSRQLNLDPYVMGLFLGDGCYNRSVNQINLTMALSDMKDIEKHIPYPVRKSIGREITHMIDPGSRARTIFDNYGLCKLKSHNKFIPKDYLYNTEENRIKLLNGLLDSDGTCSLDCSVIEYSTKSPLLKDDFIFLCRSLGFGCKATPRVINGETYFRCYLYSNDNRLFNLKRKKDRLKTKSRDAYNNKTAIASVEFSHREKAKCVTVDSPTHLHLIDDFIITHNSSWMGFEEFGAFPKFLDLWQTSIPNVQDGSAIFGQASAVGTGGSEGADFQGAIEMLNYPDGYNVYSLPNVYDKGATGNKKTIFFFPGYINLKGYYNKDGVSDVIGALIYEIEFRINLKYNSSDPLQLTRRKAETAFTIQDAIMKRDGSLYPTDKLNDMINEINLNPKYTDDMWIGRLSLSKSGEVEYKPDNDLKYITEFPHKDNKIEGAICIKHMPVKSSSGTVPWGRYIAGADVLI